MWQLPILHGPNLNLTGERETSIYGKKSIELYLEELANEFNSINLIYHQSNHEGQLIDWIQEYRNYAHAILINPGAYTHTSIALRDAIASIKIPVVEVHISDTSSREDFRKLSYLKEVAFFSIAGFGLEGYRIAILRLLEIFPTISNK